jgi:hypothetical protein
MTPPTKTAWEQGLNLADALERYSDETLWREHVNLSHQLFPHIPEDLPPQPINWEPQPLLAKTPTEEFGRYLRLEQQLRTALLEKLRDGALKAIAYVRPKHRGDDPVWIAPDQWSPDGVSWEESELLVNGNQFAEVRIVDLATEVMEATMSGAFSVEATRTPPAAPAPGDVVRVVLVHSEPVEPVPSATRRRRGRPTRALEIQDAYDALKNSAEIDFKKSLRANLPAIQAAACRLTAIDPPSTKGLGYEVVRRTIGWKFFRDKAEAAEAS